MKVEITSDRILLFFKKNWFNAVLLVLALYVFFKKDLSFQFQVEAPEKTEQKTARKSPEKITDASPALSSNTGATDRLEIPFIGGQRSGRNALSELAAIDESTRQAYLERFAKVALDEQKKFGIPASVILATALHQSCAGKQDLTLQANNHFALPCTGGWQGGCADFQGQSHRRYESAWASFRDFSLFANENFAGLKGQDYKGWANGMQKAGFGEDENFGKNLMQIIEEYRLFELDKKG